MLLDHDDETFGNLRNAIFRGEAKAGVREVMEYLRLRRGDAILWPPRPELSIFGVKNCLGRLRDDLALVEVMTKYETGHMIRIVSTSKSIETASC